MLNYHQMLDANEVLCITVVTGSEGAQILPNARLQQAPVHCNRCTVTAVVISSQNKAYNSGGDNSPRGTSYR